MRKAIILISGFAVLIIPAGAQISTDRAVQICRNEVRQDASNRFGSPNIEFRSTTVKDRDVVRDQVEGSFALRKSEGAEMHTFACSVDAAAANLRWERIDSQNVLDSSAGSANRAAAPEPEENAAAVSRNETANNGAEATDTCRHVVRGKVRDHGYIGADFTSISIDNTPDRGTLVTGKVTGETGGHENLFSFSCDVDRTTGAVRSLELNGH